MTDLEPEQEIDLGRISRLILRGWWLVIAGTAVGLAIGFLIGTSGGTLFEARSTVYLGYPLASNGVNALQTLQTNPSTAGQIVRGQKLISSVADQVGLNARTLRQNTSVRVITSFVKSNGQKPLVEVIVRGDDRAKITEASNLLSGSLVETTSAFADIKIASLEEALVEKNRESADLNQKLNEFETFLQESPVSPEMRISVVVASQAASQRHGVLAASILLNELDLAVAKEVERGSLLSVASAMKIDARSRGSSAIVGAVIGGILGIALVFLRHAPFIRSRFGQPRVQ